MIEITNVSKSYGDTCVVDAVSLSIPAGGITSIIGPNGAGKSTLLSMISRLLPMSSGKVSVDGLDVTHTPSDVLAKRLAILRQDNHLSARLTVRDLVGFGRYPHSKGRPTLEDKADIVRNAIDLAHVLGVAEPKVAILAAVETVNSRMPSTLDAAALCKMADRGQITGGLLDGPLAFDNAVSPEAARVKGIVSAVAGQADILVVPDLESGNMLAKQLEYMGHADSAGIVLGARVPVVLTSRSDSRRSRLASCAIALMLAHHYRTSPP